MRTSPLQRVLLVLAVLALVASGSLTAVSQEAPSGVAAEAVTPIDPLSPNDHGAAPLDGLQYPDPDEALALIDAPEANSEGTATASYALDVPPGHGITPELAVTYGSSGGNGWMGVGWDLSVGEIEVDTSFGAPHFDPAFESESYTHDGDLLVPNAIDQGWEPRVPGTRRDYTHQVETEYAEIIRHAAGNGGPDDYFWEVRGKDGGVRWYGATPDSGGPVPTAASAPTLDESAVVRDVDGNIVRWLLSAERDIGVNLIRYQWDTVTYAFADGDWVVNESCNSSDAVCGEHTYLDRILYTDATSAITDFNGPPYEIDFIRESELAGSGDAVRSDPVVDARHGYVDVLADRLARVEVSYGVAPSSGSSRTYDQIAARYSFDYSTGWFGKSLLSSITQGVDDLHEHTLTYHNELGAVNTDVAGFDTPATWTSANDVAAELFLDSEADVSTLGGSETNAGSGNLYIGFNPAVPSKTGSFGVGLEFSGGDTDAIAEWIDLNGDGLPDKVFRSSTGVSFRLNTSGPSGSGFATGSAGTASNLSSLSKDSNFGFQISAEAYPVVALGLGTGLSFSWSSSYFSDVNADGLVDFVSGGQVRFNRLVDGVPTFSTSSADTPVPLAPASLPALDNEQLAEIDELFAIQSPPVDTVRRFTAPFSGTVSIAAPVTLDSVGLATTDGVRVAIQHGGDEFRSDVLTSASPSAFAAPTTRSVTAGDQLYFRVGAVSDGVSDRVTWAPKVTYTGVAWSTDANGLSQTTYDAGADFTLAGRPGDVIAMPSGGTARVEATIDIDEALTDAVSLRVVRHDATFDHATDRVVTTPTTVPVPGGTLARGSTGETTLSVQVPVTVTEVVSDEDADGDGALDKVVVADRLEVSLAADSPVDLSAVEWSGTITYDAATDLAGNPVPLVDAAGNPLFEHHVRPHVDVYPYAHPATAAASTALPNTFTAVLRVDALADDPGTATAIVTFKNSNGIVKLSRPITDLGTVEFDVNLSSIAGAPYFVDVSVRSAAFSRGGLRLVRLDRYTDPEKTASAPIAGTLRWAGMQGVFPQPYRGWAVAGYTAAGDLATDRIDAGAFEIDFDADAEVTEPDRDDVSLEESNAQRSYAFVAAPQSDGGTTGDPVETDRWTGPRPSIFADANTMQTSRLVADFASLSSLQSGGGSGERSGPTRLGIGGPGLTLMFGIGPLAGSAGLSPSWGITDFEDLNGDGYPDVVSAGQVTYTDQIGGYLGSRGVGGTAVTNQDLTFSVNGGLSSGMVDIVPNSKGGTNATHGNSAGRGSSAADAGPSFSLGISGSGGFTWTSPNASGGADDSNPTSTYGEQLSSLEADSNNDDVAIQRAFADVNGDGLADNVFTTADGVFANYNLGYSFTDKAVKLGTGGFESRESASGGAGLGFSLPYGEFGGGVNLLWNYDWSRYSWRDVNGDGILDQLHRIGESDVKVAFGTGSGLLPAIDYGDLADVQVSDLITSGQHVAFDRSSGIGGGVSATGYIGPLCLPLPLCYIVIGGGGGYNNSRSSTTADVEDVNGDGFADVLMSTDDSALRVSLNKQGSTNLLQSVTNPLGGSFTLSYARKGNTTDHPDSVWVMDEVAVDDGRPGDGEDVYTRQFAYDGLRYDRAHRASLGFSSVSTTEVDQAGNPLRLTEQSFLNDNVFVAGLLTEVTTLDPTTSPPTPWRGSTVTWGFRDVRVVPSDFDSRDAVTPVAADGLGETATVASRGRSIAPLVTAHSEYWYDDFGGRTFERVIEYTYDGLGNVVTERDLGDGEVADDDLVTSIEYSDCQNSTGNGCLADSPHASPLASPGTCVNWASYAGRVVVRGVDELGNPQLLRERSGFKALCDNGAVTEQRVVVERGDGPPRVAVTDMTLNQYGDYELVMSPPGEDGERYTVRNTYDEDRHTDIAMVEEFDVASSDAAAALAGGPDASRDQVGIASSATFDALSGRALSRTDANGATRHYAFDELGRLVSISTMTPAGGTPSPLVTYEYNANDAGYAHAFARHADASDGNNPAGSDDAAGEDTTATIDTITFVDGLGRVTQTKRDARIVAPGTTSPTNTRQVTGSVSFDALGRPAIDYGPVVDDGPAGAFTSAAFGGKQTTKAYSLVDTIDELTDPAGRTTTYAYVFDQPEGTEQLLSTLVITDPEERVTIIGDDVRDHRVVHIDTPAPRSDDVGHPITPPDPLYTYYDLNALGETRAVTDSTGAVTSYSYDLAGNNVAVTTPNQGTTTFDWDLAGRRTARVNERMRAAGTQTEYRYDLDRLAEVDNPGVVDDVTYGYGLDNSDGQFTAGRVRHIDDRARLVDNSYDATGALIRQRVEVKRHNWRPGLSESEREQFRSTTEWSYDDLGRIASVRYPDAKTVGLVPTGTSVASLTDPSQLATLVEQVDLPGELVTYDYDSGGMLREIDGLEQGRQFVREPIDQIIDGIQTTVMVPRPIDHTYDYLLERLYDHRLLTIEDSMGNGTVTSRVFDPDTSWLTEQDTTAPGGDPAAPRIEIQDLAYTYDDVGRPLTYANDLPYANRAINGGRASQTYDYDGFGRIVAAAGSFSLKATETQQYTYGTTFTSEAPWNVVAKDQTDRLVTTKPNGSPGSVKVTEATTYSFDRTLGTTGGPLRVFSDARTDAAGASTTYGYAYNANGAIETMLAQPAPGSGGKKGGKPSEPNVWDRSFTWNQLDQMTSANDGSELRTFAYDDVGNLTIQDGNLLADDGTVVANHGGGPETIFLNQWVTIRSQKIYKHVWAGDDRLLVQMDSDAEFETKQLYAHDDLVGSTNIITDDQGRGFQRHEYFPSGEIWIDDHKEQIRTPFQFAEGYYEDEFGIILFGSRWYDTERELFLSADPVLVNDVGALIDQPALGGEYTYAGANGASNVDPSGQTFFSAHQRVDIIRRAEQDFELDVFGMRLAMDEDGARSAVETRKKRLEAQDRAELLQTNAILIIDLNEQKVSIGAPYGPRKKWPIGSSSGASDKEGDKPADARDGSGGPDAGGDGADPGSSDIDTSNSASSPGSGAADDAGSASESDDSTSASDSAIRDVGGPAKDSRTDS